MALADIVVGGEWANDGLVGIVFTVGLIWLIRFVYKTSQNGKATGIEFRCTKCGSGPLKEKQGDDYKTCVYCPTCCETTYTGTWS